MLSRLGAARRAPVRCSKSGFSPGCPSAVTMSVAAAPGGSPVTVALTPDEPADVADLLGGHGEVGLVGCDHLDALGVGRRGVVVGVAGLVGADGAVAGVDERDGRAGHAHTSLSVVVNVDRVAGVAAGGA